MTLQLLSINVGTPKNIEYKDKVIRTAIFKKPIHGLANVEKLGIDGDGQADLRVHGGIDKAVYAYGANHFSYWPNVLNGRPIRYGDFGENLTFDEVDESQMCIGDFIRVGNVEFMISEPRIPCFKLGVAFDDNNMLRLFKDAQRPGFYLRVVTSGKIEKGMPIRWDQNYKERVSINALYEAILNRTAAESKEVFRRTQSLPIVSESLKANIDLALS